MDDALPSPQLMNVRAPRLLGAVGAIAMYFAIQLLTALLVSIVLMLAHSLQHANVDPLRLLHDRQFKFAVVGISMPIACAITWLLLRLMYARSWRVGEPHGIGLVPIRLPDFLRQMLMGFGLMLLGGMLNHLLVGDHPLHETIVDAMLRASPATRLLLMLTAFTLVPLIEEILFRGILLSALIRHMPVWVAVAADSVLFALIHLPDLHFRPEGLLSLAIVGLVCCWRRLKSGSLFGSIAVHAGFNLMASIALLLYLAR